jgi:hypothetical protein
MKIIKYTLGNLTKLFEPSSLVFDTNAIIILTTNIIADIFKKFISIYINYLLIKYLLLKSLYSAFLKVANTPDRVDLPTPI